jgi:DHA1 family bicyclomycin/chloramphenicol resistance-like MFS transporter
MTAPLINTTPQTTSKEFVILMGLLMSVVALAIDTMLPALGIISRDMNITNPNHAQYIVGFLFMGMSAGELICGPLSDALGRKRILYIGLGLFVIGSVICFMAQSFPLLLLGRLIQGIGVAGPYISSVSIVRDKYSGDDMARAMSFIFMIFMVVPAIAPSLGQAILHHGSWRLIALFYIAYAIVITFWMTWRLEETLPVEKRVPFIWENIRHGFREVIGNRATLFYTLCMTFVIAALFSYVSSCQQIFQGLYKTGEMFPIYFGMLALVIAAASFTNGRIVKRFHMRTITLVALTGMVVISALFLTLHLFIAPSLWMFMVYAAGIYFAFGLVMGNTNALAMEPMGHIAGTASAVMSSISGIISMILSTVIGQMYNDTLIPLTTGFLTLGSVALLFAIYAQDKK